MILILSEKEDITTTLVVNWIESLGGRCIRIDFFEGIEFGIDNNSSNLRLLTNNKSFSTDDFGCVWARRCPTLSSKNEMEVANSILFANIKQTCHFEKTKLYEFFIHSISDKYILGDFTGGHLNKLFQLKSAVRCGINIPDTIVTSKKSELLNFFHKHKGNVITKAIQDISSFIYDGYSYSAITSEVPIELINEMDEVFFPCLMQEKIEKTIEIRTFFIEQKLYSMAIFSQAHECTRVDYRMFDKKNPSRRVPYTLPNELKKQILQLMKMLSLNSGSIDLIYNKALNKYIYLEVNPVGQFGMVSYPCNYFLEKKIAELLIRKDTEYEKRQMYNKQICEKHE